MTEIFGNISSIETGFVDGPGIRVVVYFQGCPLRCIYCHNPENWNDKQQKSLMTPHQVLDKIKKYSSYFGESGGVTFSGGEPLMQPDFLLEILKLCKTNGIHTTLDTSGYGENYKELLDYVDLVILDIKALSEKDYKSLTHKSIEKFNKFLKSVQEKNIPLWLRQVIIPNINDNDKNILNLKKFVSNLNNVEKIELLPYHDMAKEKYSKLGVIYPLHNTPPLDKAKLKELQKLL